MKDENQDEGKLTDKEKRAKVLEEIIEESLMLDDHGPVIIGQREDRPHFKTSESTQKN